MFPYIVLEIRRTLRDGFFMIFGIGMPVLMYLLFTNLGAGGDDAAEWKVVSMVGMAAYGALGAAMSHRHGRRVRQVPRLAPAVADHPARPVAGWSPAARSAVR